MALARWLSWMERRSEHQKGVGSVAGQGTGLGCGFDPQSGHVWEATDCCFSPSSPPTPPPPLPLSLKSMNMSSGEDLKKSAQWFCMKCFNFTDYVVCIIKHLLNKLLANQNLLLWAEFWEFKDWRVVHWDLLKVFIDQSICWFCIIYLFQVEEKLNIVY